MQGYDDDQANHLFQGVAVPIQSGKICRISAGPIATEGANKTVKWEGTKEMNMNDCILKVLPSLKSKIRALVDVDMHRAPRLSPFMTPFFNTARGD